jgi:glycosyltransferase involved in cell wall biosynthesis
MPAYNEADGIVENILRIGKEFEAVCQDYEIVVVDDGSIDKTRVLVENLADDRVRIVSYNRNEGKGHAIKAGFSRVTGEFAFIIDSDLEIRGRNLDAYLKALETGDIVIGSKRHPDSMVRTPVIRRFLSLGYNALERLLTGLQASDTQAGFKAARSTALYRIFPLLSVKKFAFDVELLAVASLLKLRIKELPVDVELKAMFSVTQVFRMLIDLLGIAYRIKVKRWYQRNALNHTSTYEPIIRW